MRFAITLNLNIFFFKLPVIENFQVMKNPNTQSQF